LKNRISLTTVKFCVPPATARAHAYMEHEHNSQTRQFERVLDDLVTTMGLVAKLSVRHPNGTVAYFTDIFYCWEFGLANIHRNLLHHCGVSLPKHYTLWNDDFAYSMAWLASHRRNRKGVYPDSGNEILTESTVVQNNSCTGRLLVQLMYKFTDQKSEEARHVRHVKPEVFGRLLINCHEREVFEVERFMLSNGYVCYLYDQTYLEYCVKAVRHEGQELSLPLMIKRATLLLRRLEEFFMIKQNKQFDHSKLKVTSTAAVDKFDDCPWYDQKIWLEFQRTLKYLLAIVARDVPKEYQKRFSQEIQRSMVSLRQIAAISETNRKSDKSDKHPVKAKPDYVDSTTIGASRTKGIVAVQSQPRIDSR